MTSRSRKPAWPLLVLAFLASVLLLAAQKISLPPRLVFAAAAGGSKALSAKDRIQVFEKVWKDIDDTYYDPQFHGVNWKEVHDRYLPLLGQVKTDADFYDLLNRMTGELHDAHTRFNTPQQWEDRQKQQGLIMGFQADEIDGKTVITTVLPNSSAARAGVQPGMIVLSVEGQPIADRLAEFSREAPVSSSERITEVHIISAALAGTPGEPTKFAFARADGSSWPISLSRQLMLLPPDVVSHTLPSGYAYIRFDGFERGVDKEFHDALASFRNSPGLIVDLRWNGGGRSDVLNAITGFFLNQETVIARSMARKDVGISESSFPDSAHRTEFKAGKNGGQQYSGSVVILTSVRTASSSELFAGALQELGRAKIVGSQTCGCVIGIHNQRAMKGGGVLEVSQILWFSIKGRKYEGEGIIPDETVLPTIAALQQNRDVVLAAAEQLLRARAAKQ